MDYIEEIERILTTIRPSKQTTELIRVFKTALKKFDYNGYFIGLSNLFSTIIEFRDKGSNKDKAKIDKAIAPYISIVDHYIESRPTFIKTDNPNYIELINIQNKFMETGLKPKKPLHKVVRSEWQLLYILFFDVKNNSYINSVINDNYDLVNVYSPEGEPIIYHVIDKFLESIDSYINSTSSKCIKYNNDVLYLSDLVSKLLSADSQFVYNEEIEEHCLLMINRFIEEKNYTNEEDVKYMVHWLDKMVSILNKEDLESDLDEAYTETKTEVPTIIVGTQKYDFSSSYEEFEKREHSDEYIISIDTSGARVLDDGLSTKRLSNGNYLLGIHIADPLAYIGNCRELFDLAYERTTSAYARGIAPLHTFPEELYEFASLDEGKDRLAFSYYLEITPEGTIIFDHFTIKKRVINVSRNIRYSDIDEIDLGDQPKHVQTVSTLIDIYNALTNREDTSDRVMTSLGETCDGTLGSSINARCMISLGTVIARYMKSIDAPFVYTANVSEKRFKDKIKQKVSLANLDQKEERSLYHSILNDNSGSFYTVNPNQTHLGLGEINYARVTSPLIEFVSCLNMEAINLFYFDGIKDCSFRDSKLHEYGERCRYMNQKVKALEHFSRRVSSIPRNEQE